MNPNGPPVDANHKYFCQLCKEHVAYDHIHCTICLDLPVINKNKHLHCLQCPDGLVPDIDAFGPCEDDGHHTTFIEEDDDCLGRYLFESKTISHVHCQQCGDILYSEYAGSHVHCADCVGNPMVIGYHKHCPDCNDDSNQNI